MRLFIRTLIIALGILSSGIAYSAIVPFHTRLYTPYLGTAVEIGQPSATGIVTITGSGDYIDRFVSGVVTLGVDHHYPAVLSSMRVKVKLRVLGWSDASAGSSDITDTICLDVSYSPDDSITFIDKQSKILSGMEKYSITIIEITVNGSPETELPVNLYIDADLYADRYFDFADNAETEISVLASPDEDDLIDTDCDEIMDVLRISWPPMEGAEEYQLEWTYINDYGETISSFVDPENLPYNFKLNSTRVSTPYTSYDISLAFDHGYICYRVRAIGRDITDLTNRIFGVWSAPDAGFVDETEHFYQDWSYEGDKNWQYSTTYAEEGKKKEVISFFDGSLRNRQMVTKVNSDENTIVGETIYDHQGRPAIQVLPVPVSDPDCEAEEKQNSLKYYPNFNLNQHGDAYSRTDFDTSTVVDSCNIETRTMKSTSGASNYYSSDNPDQTGHNAYIPDALDRPFTQVEYTPDNTGRIRRQGGVGEGFELGSGHETKYWYGHPTQIQLDRMFGSEVGDAAHYQKNMVMDPNGQVSISYLDQEGRVIATSLAGETPGETLLSLESAGSTPLTDDMFATDANENTASNVLSADGKSKVFSEVMLVPADGDYTFTYNMSVGVFDDPCLAENICFNCVYDLAIRVYDECGIDVTAGEDLPVHAGYFTLDDDVLEFTTACQEEGPGYELPEATFTLPLITGSYVVTKVLTVNQEAIDFYVDAYLDPEINTCIKTLTDFEEEFLAATDFSDCELSEGCAECIEALGTIEDFIANGLGTANEYQLQRENCEAPCKQPSMCETYQGILAGDVSPGGQYGEYMTTAETTDPTIFPLSVYNEYNVLPHVDANWKHPLAIIEGIEVTKYLEEDLYTRSIVELHDISFAPDGSVGSTNPEVTDLGEVHFDATANQYFTYPEFLTNVSDFIHEWKPSWAQSLLIYHPEYSFYKTCLEYTVRVNEGDAFTSESFDQLISRVETWQEAIDEGLIDIDYASTSNVYDRITDWFTAGAHAWDPFVVYGSTSYDNYGDDLQTKFYDYLVVDGYHYSMPEAAAMMTRCGSTLVGGSPSLPCTRFGDDYDPLDPVVSDVMRDEEWKRLKALYISAKQAIQQELAIQRSVNDPDYYGYNGCIGNEDFNPLQYGFFDPSTFLSSQAFNTEQPCNASHEALYKYKQKRFATPSDLLPTDVNEVAYQQYLITGQCPTASSLQAFLSQAVGSLEETSFLMNSFPAFSGMYLAFNNFYITTPAPDIEWQQTTLTSTLLEADFVAAPSIVTGNISLEIPAVTPVAYSWDDILSFSNLRFISESGGDYYFEITALINTPDGTISDILTGHTSGDLENCHFNEVCHLNDLGRDLLPLLSKLAFEGDLTYPSAVQILGGSSIYEPLVTPALQEAINPAPITTAYWKYDATNHAFMLAETGSAERLELKINSTVPSTFPLANLNLIGGFTSLVPTQSNSFDLVATDFAGNYLVTLKCDAIYWDDAETTQIPVGDCVLPTPASCEGIAFENTRNLGKVIIDVLNNQTYDAGDGYDLTASSFYNSDLILLVGPSGAVTQSETESNVVEGIYTETTTILNDEMCELVLTHHDDNAPALTWEDLVSVSDFTPAGERDEWGNFHNFYVLATYEVASVIYEDTIFGSTCIPLNVCELCAPSFSLFSFAPMAAEAPSNCEALYDQYLDAYLYFQMQQQDDLTCEDYPTEIPLLTLQDFIDNNICCNPEDFDDVYTNFIEQFRRSTPCPEDALPFYESCEETYDPQDYPCRETYREFLELLDAYNYSPWAIANSTFLDYDAFGSASEFYASGKCYCIPFYADYLQDYITAGAMDVLPPPVAAKDFEGCAYSVPEVPDTCVFLYNSYLSAYSDFQQTQLADSTCEDYQTLYPPLTYQDFIDNNICCSFANMLATAPFVGQFSEPGCPINPLPSYPSCEDPTPAANPCGERFYAYLLKIEDYNNSDWAQENQVFLDYNIFDSYESFEMRCECFETYMSYLDVYINADAEDVLRRPYQITSMESCNEQIPPCDLAFEQYNACVSSFNVWADDNDYDLADKLDKGDFISGDLCGCVDAYCAYLNDVIDGFVSQVDYEEHPGIEELCEEHGPQPCSPDIPLAGGEEFPTGIFDDPCTEYLTNMAYANASNAYDEYLDSVKNYIATHYVEHCMGAAETFVRSYTDVEHHRTLYYYDQAGNLIKTVPPEGVELLDIASSTDPLELLVQQDRNEGTHKVLTSHRMATTYVYNSLNQLIRQSTPDQDQMDIWEITLPNGLQAGLNTTAIQMVNSNRGYLTGTVDFSGNVRAFLYRTDNGGTNWTKVNNTVASDLKKIQFAPSSSTIAYAIGKEGTILKTVDGGASWDLLNTHSVGVTFDLKDIFVYSTTAAVFVGESGSSFYTLDGGETFATSLGVLPSGTPGSIIDVKAIDKDSDGELTAITIDNGTQQYDAILHVDNNFMEPIKGDGYNNIDFYDGTHGVLGGKWGGLIYLKTPATGTNFNQTTFPLKSGVNSKKTYFLNSERGVILNGDGFLLFTLDGGASWENLESSTYNSLELLGRSSTQIELLAIGYDLTKRIILPVDAAPQLIDHSFTIVPQNLDINAAAVYSDGGKHLMVGVGNRVYYSSAIVTGYEHVQYTDIGMLNPSTGATVYEIVLHTFSGGIVSGVILGSDGLYAIHRSSAGSPFVISSISTGMGTTDFADILLDESDQQVFAFEKTDRKLHKLQLSNLGAVTSSTASSLALPGTFGVAAMAQNAGRITVAGDSEIYTSNDVSGSNTLMDWDERSALRISQSINDIALTTGDKMLFVGDGALIGFRGGTGSSASWILSQGGKASDYKATGGNGSKMVIAGTNGFVSTISTSGGPVVNQQLTNNQLVQDYFSNVDFTGVAIDGDKVYVCGTNSTILNLNDINSDNFSYTSGLHSGVDFSGIDFLNGYNVAYATGNDSRIYRFVALTGTQVKNVFNDELKDVHFADANNGTIVGNDFFVRQTHNGGTSWEVVLPDNDVSTQLGADLRRVWTVNGNYVLLAGDDHLSSISNNISTKQTVGGSPDFHAIQFGNDPLNGFVTNGGSVQKIALTPSGSTYTVALGTSYTPSSTPTQLNALHIFENGNVMAVGTDSYTGYLTLPAGTFDDYTPAGTTDVYNDVYFHDDVTGYVVGDAGLIYRTTDVAIDPVTHAITTLDWEQKDVEDAQVTANADIDIKAITFQDHNNGIWGGNYASGYSGAVNPCYLRKIKDESGDFSTRFFYDRLGRLVLSQNSRQHHDNKYSYSLYDALGRVYEGGEKTENSTGDLFASVFGTNIGGQYIPTVVDDIKLSNWLAAGNGARKEVTRNYYDETVITGLPVDFDPNTGTQRKRITHVTYEAVYDGDDQTYDHATHYDYDIHGNVQTLLQDNLKMADDPLLVNNRFKRMDYNYDLISGNVHRVSYQKGEADQWHHAYTYDADNRITQAYTTTTTPLSDPALGQTASENEPGLTPYWDREAEYAYYAHGPLARTELGEEDVQGIDYVYTIQGWMKSVNSNTLDVTRDPGASISTATEGRDVYGYSLHYYDGDYAQIGSGGNSFAGDQTGSDLVANSNNLYNGNIGRMVTTITNPDTRDVLPLGNAYKYDQLNRLITSKSYTNLNLSTNAWGSGQLAKYQNEFVYDANGNIINQVRYNDESTKIDDMTYNYKRNSDGRIVQNRLYHINDDDVSAGTFPDDIDDMGTFDGDPNDVNVNNNYGYDQEGRLIRDDQEGIENIEWRVDGKVLKITRPSVSAKKNLIFEYDAMGNRIAKHVLTAEDVLEKSTYYVLDAQGNTMSVYERVVDETEESIAFYQAEKHIYGSSRLGVMNDKISLLGSDNEDYDMTVTNHVIGKRTYELSNHLGNVLSVISDKPIPHDDDADDDVDWYLADIRLARDYSPFGVTLSGRSFEKDYGCEEVLPSIVGWTYSGTTGTVSLEHTGDQLVFNSPTRYRCSQRSFVTVPGETYSVTIDIDMTGLTEDVYVLLDDNSSPASFSASGPHTFTFTAAETLTTMRICLGNEGGGAPGDYSYAINSFKVTGGVGTTDCPEVDVFNDDFESTDGGWIERSYPVSFGLEDGKLKVVSSVVGQGAKKTVTTVIGEEYTFSFNLSGMDINHRMQVLIYNASTSTYYNDPYVFFCNGTYQLTFTAASTSTRVEFYPQDFNTGTFSPNCTFLLDDTRLYSFDESGPCSSSVVDDQVIVDDRFEDEVVCSVEGDDYRYGFNGMEKDDEMKGLGNSYNFGARMLDPRLGRWLTIDPLFKNQPDQSPYKSFYNSPLVFKDPDGKDELLTIIIVDNNGNQARIRYPDPISNKLRAGPVYGYKKHNPLKYQNYYNYRTVITVTMDENGALDWENAKTTLFTFKDQRRKTVKMVSETISAVPNGGIVDPTEKSWDLTGNGGSQKAGVSYTTAGGGASPTKQRALTPTEMQDIESFIYFLNVGRGLSAKTDGLEDIMADLKTIEELRLERRANKEADENVGVQSSRNVPNSNKTYWKKGEDGKYHGERPLATQEEMQKGDTLGGNPDVNIYIKK